jgi:hypothetical protein
MAKPRSGTDGVTDQEVRRAKVDFKILDYLTNGAFQVHRVPADDRCND